MDAEAVAKEFYANHVSGLLDQLCDVNDKLEITKALAVALTTFAAQQVAQAKRETWEEATTMLEQTQAIGNWSIGFSDLRGEFRRRAHQEETK